MNHPAHDAPSHRIPSGQTLLIDADDTLWENNIYFEEVIARYISLLDHQVHTPAEVRAHLNRTEHATIAANGYGLKSFRTSLIRCLEDLLQTKATAEQHREIAVLVDHIGEHAIELLHGVEATLQSLQERHRLMLVTKGDSTEQTEKLTQSGLTPLFTVIEVLREKDAAAYRDLAARHRLDTGCTWMIGNSPRSDINPALAAGLNAVLVPHEFTWVLEHEAIDQAPKGRTLLAVGSFPELLSHF